MGSNAWPCWLPSWVGSFERTPSLFAIWSSGSVNDEFSPPPAPAFCRLNAHADGAVNKRKPAAIKASRYRSIVMIPHFPRLEIIAPEGSRMPVRRSGRSRKRPPATSSGIATAKRRSAIGCQAAHQRRGAAHRGPLINRPHILRRHSAGGRIVASVPAVPGMGSPAPSKPHAGLLSVRRHIQRELRQSDGLRGGVRPPQGSEKRPLVVTGPRRGSTRRRDPRQARDYAAKKKKAAGGGSL